jgi:hypothetical protein
VLDLMSGSRMIGSWSESPNKSRPKSFWNFGGRPLTSRPWFGEVIGLRLGYRCFGQADLKLDSSKNWVVTKENGNLYSSPCEVSEVFGNLSSGSSFASHSLNVSQFLPTHLAPFQTQPANTAWIKMSRSFSLANLSNLYYESMSI